MEQIMEPKESKCGRATKQNDNGLVIQSIPANKQFESHQVRQVRPRYSTRTTILSELA